MGITADGGVDKKEVRSEQKPALKVKPEDSGRTFITLTGSESRR